MDEQRLIDANNFPAKRLDPDECLCGRMYACGWNGVIHLIEDAHTIDPESLPIVQQHGGQPKPWDIKGLSLISSNRRTGRALERLAGNA